MEPITGYNNSWMDNTEVSVTVIDHVGIELRVGSPYGQGKSRVIIMDTLGALDLTRRLLRAATKLVRMAEAVPQAPSRIG